MYKITIRKFIEGEAYRQWEEVYEQTLEEMDLPRVVIFLNTPPVYPIKEKKIE